MREKLLQALKRHANYRGLAIVRESVLLDETKLDPNVLRETLRDLQESHAVDILSPLPFLVLKLLKWPGKGQESTESGHDAYSYSKLFNKNILRNSYRDGELMQEILETLGESNAESFRMAVENYSPHVIRTALDRVRRAKNIRKNKTALFRHLLPRIAKESHPAR